MVSMRKSRLSVYKQDRLVEHFVSGSMARTAAALVSVNKSTVAYFYHWHRKLLCLLTKDRSCTNFHRGAPKGGRSFPVSAIIQARPCEKEPKNGGFTKIF